MYDDDLAVQILSQVVGKKKTEISASAMAYVWESPDHDFCTECGTIFHISSINKPCSGCNPAKQPDKQ